MSEKEGMGGYRKRQDFWTIYDCGIVVYYFRVWFLSQVRFTDLGSSPFDTWRLVSKCRVLFPYMTPSVCICAFNFNHWSPDSATRFYLSMKYSIFFLPVSFIYFFGKTRSWLVVKFYVESIWSDYLTWSNKILIK